MLGIRWLRLGCILIVLLVACQPQAPQGYASARALSRALQEAGAPVEDTAMLAPPAFEAQSAQAWLVDDDVVYVYEFSEAQRVREVASSIDREGRTFAGEPLPWSEQVSLWSSGNVLVAYEGTDGGLILLLSGLLGDPLTVPTEIPQGPYPPAVTAALLAWSEALAIDPAMIEVVSYSQAEWASTCLGLPAAGEACAGVVTPGWQVELRSGDRTVTVHTDELGLQVRLAADG